MTAPEFDAVIAGGGLGGLSLAARLAAGAWRDRRVLLVDDGTTPAAQCWAFWERTDAEPPLAGTTAGTFDRVRVHAAGSSLVVPLGRYQYRYVRRPELRRTVLDLMSRCPGFEFRVGHVEAIRDGEGWAETVVDGNAIRSGWVLDSVGHGPAGAGNGRPVDAWLAFTGWEVRCPTPVFDPDTPVLFDFRTPQAGGSRFVYVLPTDPHRALVELTSFVPRRAAPPAPADREAALVAYLRDVVGCADYEIIRTEAAVLPLRAFPPPRRHGRVLSIGAAGGLVKASTGYAYQRIQSDSAAIADSLARYSHPFALPAPRRRPRLLDAILLEVLDRDPARLEQTFAQLFATGLPVLAFLDEETTLAQELRLITSLPPVPYLRAAARLAARTVRRLPRRTR